MKRDLLSIGRVVKPHGVKGRVKVDYFGDDLSHFSVYREAFIKNRAGELRAYKILESVPQPPYLILRLKGIERREEADSLVGKEILVMRRSLPDLKEGEYYWFDILGMAVETEDGKRIGKIKEILPTGANDVYVVEGKRKEIFLPATEEVIQGIDIKNRRMRVMRMDGLWEEEDEV
jgi:16S rRNA processing protein RimM